MYGMGGIKLFEMVTAQLYELVAVQFYEVGLGQLSDKRAKQLYEIVMIL